MNDAAIQSALEIAHIHEKHLLYALDQLAPIFPITAEKILNLNEHEFLLVELLISRYSKLQDFIGSKLINIVLEKMGEFSRDLSIVDKMNKLEQLRLIKDAQSWRDMRRLRNQLSHEYPDNPGLLAEHLNEAYTLSFEMIEYLNNLREKLRQA